MDKAERTALVSIPVAILGGAGLAWAGSQRGATVWGGVPLFAALIGLAFAIQWLAFVPAYLLQSERFYDLSGSITYVSVILLAVLLSPASDGRSILLLGLVVIWAVRLGTFLFFRIQRAGKDGRFDEMKPSFLRFLNAWNLQALWVSLTLSAPLAAITAQVRKPLGWFAGIGFLIWLFGMAFEVTADAQKTRFRADPRNQGRFIRTGLWARSRHPNYFGEITLWVGVAVICLPVLRGWHWVTLVSPVFVSLLLTRISGVPMLEERADQRWGGQKEYEAYKARTPVLIPRLFPRTQE
jgi:steroid 5-alpha reductase family enzyme